jgi:hypothetical protein
MWHSLVALALVLHGAGHAVGFWMPVPAWFAVAWLVPGAAVGAGAWGVWRRAGWWPVVVLAAAVLSLLALVLVPSAAQRGPYGSALALDLLAILVLLVPRTRRAVAAR